MYDTTSSILAGMTTAQLQAALKAAQQAYVDLMTGARGVSFTYAQGDGSRSVTYEKVDQTQLTNFIKMLQMQLGIPTQRRRPIRFSYGR